MTDLVKTVSQQNSMIRIQADVIDELFCLLMQRISAEEADQLPVTDKINVAAQLRQDIDIEEG